MFVKKSLNWVFAVVGGVFLGAAAVGLSQQDGAALAPPPTRSALDLSVAFRGVANETLPAIVSIATESRGQSVVTEDGAELSPFEERFFKEFFGNDPRFNQRFQTPRRQPRQVGSGSGFIVDSKGIILTNSHVVEGAERVVVKLHDGREIEADSWDYDPRSDVAVVRISVEDTLPSIALGDSDQMQIGDWVLALGNPFNVGTTVTSGIISATGRGPGINEREEYLQTDAAINPGNSGGPLVNLHGDVVGINTAIKTRSGGYQGIGFAIPSKNVRWVAEQLIESGKVRRSYLGVQLGMLTEDVRRLMNVPRGVGALVNEVMPDTPAEGAKLESGDVILEFNGQEIADRDNLVDVVERSAPGKSYSMNVIRNGERQTLKVRLEEMPNDYTPALRRARRDTVTESTEEFDEDRLGVQVSEITDEIRSQLSLDEEVEGLVVLKVHDGTPADQAGLMPGDIIQRVGQKSINKLEDFRKALEGTNLDKGVLLRVRRDSSSQFIVLKSRE